MIETLIISGATALIMVCFGFAIREWEIAAQRKERHKYKSDIAAMKLYMESKGLKWPPPEWREDNGE